jgi:hypothetical protein
MAANDLLGPSVLLGAADTLLLLRRIGLDGVEIVVPKQGRSTETQPAGRFKTLKMAQRIAGRSEIAKRIEDGKRRALDEILSLANALRRAKLHYFGVKHTRSRPLIANRV